MWKIFSLSGGRPWLLLISVAVLVVLLWRSYTSGYVNGENAARVVCDEVQRETVSNVIKEQAVMRDAAVQRAREYWEANQEREQVVQTVEKEVIKYVEREATNTNRACLLDPDFVRIWNTANSAKAGTGAGRD